MKTYLFSYQHDGSRWAFEIKAESAEDAKARVAKLLYATYDGELIVSVPALGLRDFVVVTLATCIFVWVVSNA